VHLMETKPKESANPKENLFLFSLAFVALTKPKAASTC